MTYYSWPWHFISFFSSFGGSPDASSHVAAICTRSPCISRTIARQGFTLLVDFDLLAGLPTARTCNLAQSIERRHRTIFASSSAIVTNSVVKSTVDWRRSSSVSISRRSRALDRRHSVLACLVRELTAQPLFTPRPLRLQYGDFAAMHSMHGSVFSKRVNESFILVASQGSIVRECLEWGPSRRSYSQDAASTVTGVSFILAATLSKVLPCGISHPPRLASFSAYFHVTNVVRLAVAILKRLLECDASPVFPCGPWLHAATSECAEDDKPTPLRQVCDGQESGSP